MAVSIMSSRKLGSTNNFGQPNLDNYFQNNANLAQTNILKRKSQAPGFPAKCYKSKVRTHKGDEIKARNLVARPRLSSGSESDNDEVKESKSIKRDYAEIDNQIDNQKPTEYTNMFEIAQKKGKYNPKEYPRIPKDKALSEPRPKLKTKEEVDQDNLLKEIMGEEPSVSELATGTPLADDFAAKMKGKMSSLNKPGATLRTQSNNTEKESFSKNFKTPQYTPEEVKIFEKSNKLSGLAERPENFDDSFLEDLKKRKVTKEEELPEKRSLIEVDYDEEIDAGFDNSFEVMDEQKNFNKQRSIVEKKYKGKNYPGAFSKTELEQKIKKHMKCVPRILSGEIASPYYGHASDIAKSSSSTVLSSTEFLRLPINEFTIGFYGIKRQSAIATYLRKEFGQELENSLLTNKTMQFWSLDSFVFYVLSCDVAMRMAASDLKISTGEAFDLLFDTVDYGKYITDPIPI